MVWLAGVIGLLLGALFFGGYVGGRLAGAALVLIIGLALRSRQRGASAPPRWATPPTKSAAERWRVAGRCQRCRRCVVQAGSRVTSAAGVHT